MRSVIHTPFNAVGIRIIGRGIDQIQVLLQLSPHTAYEQGSSRGVRLEIVGDDDSYASATLGAGHGGTHLRDITHRQCAQEQPGHRTNHRASPADQSRRPYGYLQVPRPDTARAVLSETRRA